MSDKKIGAGCLFTNGKLTLAGLQRKCGQMVISGIGGKRNEGEGPHENAMRETIEELFDIAEVSKELIDLLVREFLPMKMYGTATYTFYVYSFEDLHKLLAIVSTKITSSLYDNFPSTISDLVLNRKYDTRSELPILCLVPVSQNLSFDPYFVDDINVL